MATPPATSRHIRHKLWLLPSGPDQVRLLVLREDQWGYHCAAPKSMTIRGIAMKAGRIIRKTLRCCKRYPAE